MRVFIASIATETNSFSPIPSGAMAFSLYEIRRARAGKAVPAMDSHIQVYLDLCSADDHEVVQGVRAGCQPSAPTVRAVYEELRDMLLADLRAAGPIDLILLPLHGAMAAQGYDDCEGDILARVRAIAPNAIIGVELDPHCSLTEAMVANADLITIMREYPHTDFADRARDLYRHCMAVARGEIRPVPALVDCRLIGFFPTFEPAIRPIVAAFRDSSASAGIVTAEFVQGFPWGDVPEMGAAVLVYADGDPALAVGEAERLARLVYDRRHDTAPSFPGLATSLDRAAALDGLTVLGDFADNAGGGAPGDSSFVLRELLDRGTVAAAIGAFYDPEAAGLCCDAGAGATIRLRLGGKLGPESGDPIDLEADVIATAEDHGCTAFGQRTSFGLSAAIRAGGIEILIISKRSQLYGADGFTDLGITLDDKRLVVVKSSNHYTASFGPLAAQHWHVATPGAMNLDFAALPYRKLDRPMFPMVDDPWSVGNAPVARLVAPA